MFRMQIGGWVGRVRPQEIGTVLRSAFARGEEQRPKMISLLIMQSREITRGCGQVDGRNE